LLVMLIGCGLIEPESKPTITIYAECIQNKSIMVSCKVNTTEKYITKCGQSQVFDAIVGWNTVDISGGGGTRVYESVFIKDNKNSKTINYECYE